MALVLLCPFLMLIAVFIKLDSPGPAFYLGFRTGQFGKQFRIRKFRTMRVGAETLGTTSVIDDPRVTVVGRCLRHYKLDELPQLINVLIGEMSLVGPRPEVSEHTDAYIGEERVILEVKPGITDFASIRFSNLAEELGTVDPHGEYIRRVRGEKNRLRIRYVRCRSLRTDFKILVHTFLVVLRKIKI